MWFTYLFAIDWWEPTDIFVFWRFFFFQFWIIVSRIIKNSEWWNRVDCPRPASRVSTRPGPITTLATLANTICTITQGRMGPTTTWAASRATRTITSIIRWRWKMASPSLHPHTRHPCSTCGIVVAPPAVIVATTTTTTTVRRISPTTRPKTTTTTHPPTIIRPLAKSTISLTKPLSRPLPLAQSKVKTNYTSNNTTATTTPTSPNIRFCDEREKGVLFFLVLQQPNFFTFSLSFFSTGGDCSCTLRSTPKKDRVCFSMCSREQKRKSHHSILSLHTQLTWILLHLEESKDPFLSVHSPGPSLSLFFFVVGWKKYSREYLNTNRRHLSIGI